MGIWVCGLKEQDRKAAYKAAQLYDQALEVLLECLRNLPPSERIQRDLEHALRYKMLLSKDIDKLMSSKTESQR